MADIQILSPDWDQYQLIDSGQGRKLERFGDQVVVRSEPKAWWRPDTGPEQWDLARAEFDEDRKVWIPGEGPRLARDWPLRYGPLTLEARSTGNSKHVGVFPEQEPHWRWIREQLQARSGQPRVLNLFGYTGAATLVAATTGAHVTHVDASKPAIAWARHNQALSGLEERPVRWILEDAFKYVERELRRGSRYDLILLDPPSFGRGPKGEIWKVDQQIVDLLHNLRKLLSEAPLGLLLTMYNLEASSLMLHNLVAQVLPEARMEVGELALPHQYSAKRLPLSLYARALLG